MQLLKISAHLSTRKTVWASEGRGAERELVEAQQSWQGVFHVERSVTDEVLSCRWDGGEGETMIRIAVANQKGGVGRRRPLSTLQLRSRRSAGACSLSISIHRGMRRPAWGLPGAADPLEL
jgi:hypothetical protein